MTDVTAAQVLRLRAAEHAESIRANGGEVEPWDLDWWRQQAAESMAVADLLDAVLAWSLAGDPNDRAVAEEQALDAYAAVEAAVLGGTEAGT